MISYLVSFFSGHYQEWGYQIFNQKGDIDNWTGSGGVFLAQTLIKESFGIGAFFFVYLLTLIGLRLTETVKFKMWNVWKWSLLCLVWMPLFFGFISQFTPQCAIFGGAVGKWLNELLTSYIGNAGVIIILAFLLLVFLVYQFNLTLNYFKRRREKKEEEARKQAAILAEQRIREQLEKENQNMTDGDEDIDPDFIDDEEDDDESNNESNLPPVTSFTKDPTFVIVNPDGNTEKAERKENTFIPKKEEDPQESEHTIPTLTTETENKSDNTTEKTDNEVENVELVIENTETEKTVDEGKNMEHHTIDTPFDPRYELRDFKFPTLDMLNDYGGGKSEIDEEELNANKNKIVETLGNYGNGACVVDASSWQDTEKEVQGLLEKNPDGFVAEELIVQCKEMADLNPSSINTVRITTARKLDGTLHIIKRPFIRIGQGGRCVDNGGNGGIIAAIDYETGIIKEAIDEAMNRYIVHPDTGKTILGYQIPRWEEARQLVAQLSDVFTEMRYCGWDLALTDQGWVMVEANSKGLFIGFQLPTQEGCREEFERLKHACGYEK